MNISKTYSKKLSSIADRRQSRFHTSVQYRPIEKKLKIMGSRLRKLRFERNQLIADLENLSNKYEASLTRIEVLESRLDNLALKITGKRPNIIIRVCRYIWSGGVSWITFKPGSRPRRVLKSILLKLNEILGKYPKTKKFLIKLLARYPRVYQRLQLVVGNSTPLVTGNNDHHSMFLNDLTPSAHRVYKKLDFFIHEYQGGK